MSKYNESELLAVLLSREVRDGEISACGAHSQIPASGLLLAQALHAPNAELIILNTAFTPFRTSKAFHFLCQRGELGLFFVSGVQIDRHGNYNLHQLGPDPDRPKARFPGGYGGGLIYYAARRTIVFRTEHTKRSLVEKVDFISAAGATPPEFVRLGSPTKLVTPKAAFRFEKDEGVLKLDTIHSPWSLADVRANTGFDVGVTGPVPVTPAPTHDELRTLRSVVRDKMLMASPAYAAW